MLILVGPVQSSSLFCILLLLVQITGYVSRNTLIKRSIDLECYQERSTSDMTEVNMNFLILNKIPYIKMLAVKHQHFSVLNKSYSKATVYETKYKTVWLFLS